MLGQLHDAEVLADGEWKKVILKESEGRKKVRAQMIKTSLTYKTLRKF